VSAPPIRYATNGDIHLAYRVHGDGPIDLVIVGGAFTNLDVLWEVAEYRDYMDRLAAFARVITFDKRGMGLSDRVRAGTLEERMDDVRAILDDIGSESAALVGNSEGGPMSILFAATYPERTRALILCGAEIKEETTEDWPWGESTREDFEAAMQIDRVLERWGKGLGLTGPVREPTRCSRLHADGLRDRRAARGPHDHDADARSAPRRRPDLPRGEWTLAREPPSEREVR
jgi:pimeloyl-ACP methyl ester carboxylesterase